LDIYIFALVILIVLAIVDLTVGVANDAVNFLNSAIGSRVAARRTILIVACFGVVVGALFASGIMEVARKGIFNPEMFTFSQVIIIFLAVMIADVFLLDTFNTFGFPTSTTVSIVFELLGAATAVAFLHSMNTPGAPPFAEFINSERAILIISGIGLSVVIAFIAGTVVQFVTRLLFTFEENTSTAGVRVVWSALALTMISDFLFLKGMKGASFIPSEVLAYVQSHQFIILVGLFCAWLVITAAIQRVGRNPLAFSVLAGTFALAMAFASNDLVNFIGVPLAGLASWQDWSTSSVAADAFMMDSLREPVRGDTVYLLIAGLIMSLTLWFSSKARTVTETSVTLSRQDEGTERFKPGPVSRGLVRSVINTVAGISALTPEPLKTGIASRFEREAQAAQKHDAPAFDLVRASVNLAVASILIAIATSFKLPLSTTYVAFMVAMGTSLADRAWGRDSAAYRVAGVLSVLTGWFITAAAAFTVAGLIALLLTTVGMYTLFLLVIGLVVHLFFSHRHHANRSVVDQLAKAKASTDFVHQADLLQDQVSDLLKECSRCVDLSIRGLLDGKRKRLDKAHKRAARLGEDMSEKELTLVRVLKRVKPDVDNRLLGHLELMACQQDLFQSVSKIVENARNHVLNVHESLTDELSDILAEFNTEQIETAHLQIQSWDNSKRNPAIAQHQAALEDLLDRATRTVIADLYSDVRPIKFTTLLLAMLTELADYDRELERARTLWDDFLAHDLSAMQLKRPEPA
jgi:phosphate/sulfate permease